MPMKTDAHTEKFQAFISTYVLDSVFSSWLEVG
jgi:hypothetical protein